MTFPMQKIKYSFSVKNGATPSSGEPEYWDGDIMWITPADYTTEQCYISESRRSISDMGLNSCGTNLVPKNSIIVSNRAPIGLIGIAAKPLCTSQGCKSLIKIKTHCVNEKYVYYYLATQEKTLNALGRGTTFVELSSFDLANFRIPMPPFQEQTAIVAYLDRRTAGIDGLLTDLARQAEMLDTYKRELIAEAVTKGLDKSVAMRDSGVDWIGGIPAHWKTRRIKYLYELRQERNFLPLADVELISLYTNLGVVKHSDLEKTTGNKAQNADGYKHVYKNDMVVNIILCWMGAIGLSDYNGVTSPAYDVYKPKVDMVCSKYYHYLFRTSKFCGECFKVGRGIMMMRWRTYSDQFKAITVQLPPIAEQERIATYLDAKTAQVESLIADIKAQIEKLKQYRQIVIHDAVTGNIKVTEG